MYRSLIDIGCFTYVMEKTRVNKMMYEEAKHIIPTPLY